MSGQDNLRGVPGHGPQHGLVSDPVCGVTVDPEETDARAYYHGERYCFCSGQCAERFEADPEAFCHADDEGEGKVEVSAAPPVAAAEVVEYTCPMHPQVRQLGPGACPICGMTLEPVVATVDSGPSPELVDMTRRFWVSAILTAPLLVLVMGTHLFSTIDHAIPDRLYNWLQLILASPVVLWGGWPFFTRGWTSVRTMKLNMFTLVAMGTGVAWLYSVVATVAPGLFPDSVKTHDGTVEVYFEAAAAIVTLVLLGQVLELRAREQTGDAIRALLDLTPKSAHRLDDNGQETEVHPRTKNGHPPHSTTGVARISCNQL